MTPAGNPGFTIDPIQREDDAAVATIIRTVMPEYGACGAGYAINDAEVDTMHLAYTSPRARYFVVRKDGRIVGGGGLAPLTDGDPDTCELRKMYFLPEARGAGQGARLLRLCLDEARRLGFTTCYLETTSRMIEAQRLYAKLGFEPLPGPLGSTGHFSCDRWYAKRL